MCKKFLALLLLGMTSVAYCGEESLSGLKKKNPSNSSLKVETKLWLERAWLMQALENNPCDHTECPPTPKSPRDYSECPPTPKSPRDYTECPPTPKSPSDKFESLY